MNTIHAIEARRSIRQFKSDSVPQDVLESILEAGTLAPSGKNKQPWQFYVVRANKRDEMIQAMNAGLDRLEGIGIHTGSARYTIKAMSQAPITIFVVNPTTHQPPYDWETLESKADVVDTQSIGAAIQNMLLAAYTFGVGSLWICDIFYAYDELHTWLGTDGQMIAAVSLGYPDQYPETRPRKSVNDVTIYLD